MMQATTRRPDVARQQDSHFDPFRQCATSTLRQQDLATHQLGVTANRLPIAALLATFAIGVLGPGQSAAEVYKVELVSDGPEERHWPSLNDLGNVIWSQRIGGVWQIVLNGGVLTSGADDKKYPSIDNALNMVYVNYGTPGPSTGVNRQVVLHPSTIIEFSSRDARTGSHRDAGEHPDISLDGEILSYYDFYNASTGSTVRRLNSSTRGRIDDSFYSKDFPTSFDSRAGVAYEQFGLIKSTLDPDLFEPGTVPRASRYGVVFVKPDEQLTIRKGEWSKVYLGLDRTSLAYVLDPSWPADKDPLVIYSPYADIDKFGNIVFEQKGSEIHRGYMKAGPYTAVAISAGHGRYYKSPADRGGNYQRDPVGTVTEDLVTLEIVRAAANSLRSYGVPAILPRGGDFITLPRSCYTRLDPPRPPCGADFRNRVAIAEARGAQLYIAVHTNGVKDKKKHGAFLTRPPSPDSESKKLEDEVLSALVKRLPLKEEPVFEQTLGEYTAARNAKLPVAYVEVAYHTNTAPASDQPAPYPLNNAKLADPTFLRQAGEAIARGVLGYLVGR